MSPRAISPVLVGRSEQMAALDDALRSVRQGGPAAVLLGGEAGVGKSRLVSEFTAASRRAGARVLTGGCLQLGAEGLPFAPFTALLRDLVHEMGADAFAAMLPGRATRELARLLPELGVPAGDDDPGIARARLFEQMLTVLERLSERSPVVLIIEDAHWADRSSRDLLTFLIGNQRSIGGVLVLLTYRSDELHRTHPLRPLLATLDRIDWVERVDLPRLGREETEDLALRLLGNRPEPGLADALFRRTEGNPLFVEALLGCDGELTRELPDSLRDLLLDGVHQLPEETQDVLRAASAGGTVTGHALLAAVTGLDEGVLTRTLRPAVIANVLRAEADGYAFRHELIREAVHEDLLPGEHGRLHSRFAERIDADHALVPPGRAAVEVAHHWNSAHDATWALISAWQAAAQAGKAVAPAERLGLLARVLELWERVPDAAERIGADHPRVLAEAVTAAQLSGEYERAIALVSAALKEVDAVAEPVRAGTLLHQRGHIGQRLGRPDYLADLKGALDLVPAPAAPALRCQILLDISRCGPEVGSDRAYAEEALALARDRGDRIGQAGALLTLAMFDVEAVAQASPGSEAIRQIEEGRALAEQAGSDELKIEAAINESHLLEGAGEHELAARAAVRGLGVIDNRGLLRTQGTVLAINQAEPLCALGRWDEATEVTGRMLRLSPVPMRRSQLEVLNGQIALARGDLTAAAGAAAAARKDLRAVGYEDQHQLPLGGFEILVTLGTAGPEAALVTAMRVLDSWELSGATPRYAWPVLVAGGTAVLAAARQRLDATMTMDRLRTIAEKLAAHGPRQRALLLTFTAADRLFTQLQAGLPDDTQPAWDQAAAAWQAVSEPYPRARALLRAGEAAIAAGDREAAAARLRQARSLAADLGARPLTDEIAALARRARISLGGHYTGQDTGHDALDASPVTGGLTEREREVLRLVAAGRSNREIAAELFISPKTASVHVSNILGKLGAATRTEAAARARDLGVF